jgi:hypothetical protein
MTYPDEVQRGTSGRRIRGSVAAVPMSYRDACLQSRRTKEFIVKLRMTSDKNQVHTIFDPYQGSAVYR